MPSARSGWSFSFIRNKVDISGEKAAVSRKTRPHRHPDPDVGRIRADKAREETGVDPRKFHQDQGKGGLVQKGFPPEVARGVGMDDASLRKDDPAGLRAAGEAVSAGDGVFQRARRTGASLKLPLGKPGEKGGILRIGMMIVDLVAPPPDDGIDPVEVRPPFLFSKPALFSRHCLRCPGWIGVSADGLDLRIA